MLFRQTNDLVDRMSVLFPQRLMGSVVPLVGDGVREGLGSRYRAQVQGAERGTVQAPLGIDGEEQRAESVSSPLSSSPLVSAPPLLLSPPHPGI